MNNILEKIKDIKNIKINKTLLLYIFILIPFFKPPIFDIENIIIMKKIYNILFAISGILILSIFIRKKDISKFSIITLIYILFLSITTFVNKEIDISFIKTMVTLFLITLLINHGTKYHCRDFLKAIIIITSTLIWSNFITIIMYPNGMYYNEISNMKENFLLGIDNIHIVYFLCLWISSTIYVNIYNKKTKFCSLTILISILSLIMRWSATSIIGAFIIGVYFLFFKYFSKIRLMNIKTFVITYVVGYFGIICFKLQNLFSFIIVNILKKDLTFTRRTKIWDMTIQFIKEKPIIGHGVVGYNTRNLTTGVSHAHNFFLEIVYQGGFILLAISLLLIGSVLKKLHEYYKYNLAKKLSVFIFALFVMMLMEFYSIEYTIFILALCYAIENYVIEIKNQKSKSLVDDKVIIIGGNHHNMLGVIRMLGEKNITPYLIVTNGNKYCYVTKSKYVKDFDIVEEDETAILKILKEKYSNKDEKAILIPTSDFAALLIDKNLNDLKKYFIVPSINDKQGEIAKYMDKFNQYKLAQKYHLKMTKSYEVDLYQLKNIKKFPYPCILKPLISAFGNKRDIKICQNEQELKSALEILKNNNYKKILLQELIDYDYECLIAGSCYDNQVIIPGLIKKIRIYPSKRGTTSYGKIIKSENFDLYVSKIQNMLKDMNYRGLFDIEFFVKNNELYLNEINFRNSGSAYAFMYGKVNLPYIWLLLINKQNKINENTKITDEYYFQDEVSDLKLLIHSKKGFLKYIKSFKITKSYFILSSNDMNPILYKFVYAILKRVNKQ